MTNGERFFRQTRRFDADILCVFQGKSTQYDGKRAVIWACCPFLKQGLIPEEPWHSRGVHCMTVMNFNVYFYTDEGSKAVWITAVIYGRRNQREHLKNL